MKKPPESLAELKTRLEAIKGLSFQEIAHELKIPLPRDFKRAKGFGGELIEKALGANAKNLPLPDFTGLSIELKTLPVSAKRTPLESTYICHLRLTGGERNFYNSALYRKTALMLFVAVEGEEEIPGPMRRVLSYYLFKPSAEDLAIIKNDYEEVMAEIAAGRAHEITAKTGTYVQVRPKGPSGKALVTYINEEGEVGFTRPRGFYFRTEFTRKICTLMFKAP